MKYGRWECQMVGFGGGLCMWEPSRFSKLTDDEQFVENQKEDPEFTGVKMLEPNIPKFNVGDNKESYIQSLVQGQNQRGKVILKD